MQEVEENRRPPKGLKLAEKHIQKHLPDTPQIANSNLNWRKLQCHHGQSNKA